MYWDSLYLIKVIPGIQIASLHHRGNLECPFPGGYFHQRSRWGQSLGRIWESKINHGYVPTTDTSPKFAVAVCDQTVTWRNSVPAPTIDGNSLPQGSLLSPQTWHPYCLLHCHQSNPQNFRIYFLGDMVRLNLVTVCGGRTEPCSQDWALRPTVAICALLHMSCT